MEIFFSSFNISQMLSSFNISHLHLELQTPVKEHQEQASSLRKSDLLNHCKRVFQRMCGMLFEKIEEVSVFCKFLITTEGFW